MSQEEEKTIEKSLDIFEVKVLERWGKADHGFTTSIINVCVREEDLEPVL